MTFTLPNPGSLQTKSGQGFAALCQTHPAKRLNKRGPAPCGTPAQRDGGSASDAAIIDDILARIGKTDGGASLSMDEQSQVNDLIIELEERGVSQEPRPLDNPAIYGNFNVAFSSTQRAPKQEGQPAGGGFRSKFGRALFATTGLFQSVLELDLVTNKVAFLLFGGLPGSVSLRGRLEEVEGNRDTVKVKFQPPRISLGRLIDLPIGPRSSVVLTTTYLTPQVRLGRGSRGSRFVFTKGGAADQTDLGNAGLGRTSPAGWLLLTGIFAGLCSAAWRLWIASGPGKVVSLLPALLAGLLLQAVVRDLTSPATP